MYKQQTMLGFIPARGGSKGIPRKNIKQLLGKPLLAWTIEQARKSALIDEVLVSTDDPQIRDVAKKYYCNQPYIRPRELAEDDSPTFDATRHALEWYRENKKQFDYVLLLEPTSPLRKDDDIDTAVRMLIDQKDTADSLVSLGEIHMENPYIAKLVADGYVKPFVEDSAKKIHQRQQLPASYFPYGVIYASKVDTLLQYESFYQEKTIPYYIERWQNYEVDDMYDFICIEAIIQKRKAGEK